jgi:hypothetical protein
MPAFPKPPKRERKKGKKGKDLNAECHERDGHECIVCSAYVDPDTKMHHEPCGKDKEDVIEKVVTLCPGCHNQRHGLNGQVIKQHCEWYLEYKYCSRLFTDLCTSACENPLCPVLR